MSGTTTRPSDAPIATTWRGEARANVSLAWPLVVAQIGSMMMGMVDAAIVGRVGERALAAVAVGNTLTYAIGFPVVGVAMAIEPLASQAIGALDGARARTARREGVRLMCLLSIPAAFLVWASLALLPLMKVDPTMLPETRAYVIGRLPGTLPLYAYFAFKSYQQAVGRPRAAMEAALVANLIHAAVGWTFVFGDAGLVRLHLPPIGLVARGAGGAGFATSASSVVMVVWTMWRGRTPKGALDDVPIARGFHTAVVKKLLHVGVPIGLQLAAEIGVFSVVGLMMARLGTRSAAAHQVALNMAAFSFMGALGVAQATSVRVGVAVGARVDRGPRRAGLVGLVLGFFAMAGWAIAFAVVPRVFARAFTPEEPVVHVASQLLRIAAMFQLADGAQVVAAGALRGAGDTRWPMLATIVAHWGVGLPVAWFCAFRLGLGAEGLWYGLTAGLGVIAAVLVYRFLRVTRGRIVAL